MVHFSSKINVIYVFVWVQGTSIKLNFVKTILKQNYM